MCLKTSSVNVGVRELELELDFIWSPVAFYQTEDHGIMESSCFRPAVVKSSILCCANLEQTSHFRPEGDDSYLPPPRSFIADIPNATIGCAALWISYSSVGHLETGWP